MTADSTGAAARATCSANPRLSQLAARSTPTASSRLSPGKVEIGQGILTALAQIAADELDVELARVRMIAGDDGRQPERGRHLGQPVGASIAARRVRYVGAAGARDLSSPPRPQRLGVAAESARGRGRHHHRARATCAPATGSLPTTASLDRDATCRARAEAGRGAAHRRHARGPARPARQGVRPAALHPRSGAARHAAWPRAAARPRRGAKLTALDDAAARAGAGRHRGGARRQLRRRRRRDRARGRGGARAPAQGRRHGAPGETLPDEGELAAWLKSQPVETTTVDRAHAAAAPAARGPHRSARAVHAALHRPCVDGAVLRHRAVDRRGQACRSGRTARASTICAPTSRSRWRCRRRASSSSTSRAPAATATTAPTTWRSTPCCWPARRGGRPVRVQWSRADELAWSPFGAAMAVEIEADLDAAGEIVGWRHDVWSNGHVVAARPQR